MRRITAVEYLAGMSLAVSRHATSKLSTAEDLFHIKTLAAAKPWHPLARWFLADDHLRPGAVEWGMQLRVDGGQEETLNRWGRQQGQWCGRGFILMCQPGLP
jgi:hypothetical protein